MRYRAFKIKETGQFFEGLFVENGPLDDGFNTAAASQQSDIAAALGLRPVDLEVVESGDDPRTGTLLASPVPAISPAFDWDTATDIQRMDEIRRHLDI